MNQPYRTLKPDRYRRNSRNCLHQLASFIRALSYLTHSLIKPTRYSTIAETYHHSLEIPQPLI